MTATSAASERFGLIERFTAQGQPFEIGKRMVLGVPMRVYTTGPQTLREIALAIGAFGDRPFLVYRDERWTYAEQARIVAGLARCLGEEYGLRKGDRVAVCMRNYPEWTPVFWATQALGLILVPLNAWWSAAELRYALADSGARLVVADAERTALLAPQLAELGHLPLIEVRGTGPRAPGVRRWDDVLASLPNIVRGYWNNPAATAAAFTGGWFRTGDLGQVTGGWVYVVDRAKDVIIRGGENIYCAEVEAALFEHPSIEEAAVVGVPHESLGEEAVAVVVPRAGASLAAVDVQQHVAQRLASFKVPAHVVFQSAPLPRTQSGKVLKRDLRAVVTAKVRAPRYG